MRNVITTGADGRLDGSAAADVDRIVEEALRHDRVVVHVHGGLVSRANGEAVAARLTPVYERAGACPIFVVWQSGLIEIVRHNLLEIAREELFERLMRRILAWAVGKLRDEDGGRPGALSPPRDDEVAAEAVRRLRHGDVDLGSEPYAGVASRPGAGLSEDEERAFLEDVDADRDLEDALLGAMADRRLEAGSRSGARGVPDVPPQPTRMDDDVLAEVAAETAEGGRGLVSTIALAKRALTVLKRVLARYDLGTDHGVYPTVTEEVLRAFYLGALGGAVWQAMKRETADTFLPAGDRGGRLLLDALAARLADQHRPVTLVGHSTGAVFVDNLLADVVRRDAAGDRALPAGQTFQVVLLAPAATTADFATMLGEAPDRPGGARIGRFRMFTMSDDAERADRLAGAVYPRSLLYLVSGLLERDAAAASALLPLVGLARYLEGRERLLGSPSGRAAKLEELRAYLAVPGRVVLSPTEAGAPAGARSGALRHGDFDDDPLVHESLVELVGSW